VTFDHLITTARERLHSGIDDAALRARLSVADALRKQAAHTNRSLAQLERYSRERAYLAELEARAKGRP